MYTDTGTIFYQAPEMHDNNGYGKKVDLWAVGIVVYEMLTGFKPFNSQKYTIIIFLNKFSNVLYLY